MEPVYEVSVVIYHNVFAKHLGFSVNYANLFLVGWTYHIQASKLGQFAGVMCMWKLCLCRDLDLMQVEGQVMFYPLFLLSRKHFMSNLNLCLIEVHSGLIGTDYSININHMKMYLSSS